MMTSTVMSDMVGKWRLEKRDKNFEEFLCCRNVGWFLRKLMTSTSADIEYKLSPELGTFTKVIAVYSFLRTIHLGGLFTNVYGNLGSWD